MKFKSPCTWGRHLHTGWKQKLKQESKLFPVRHSHSFPLPVWVQSPMTGISIPLKIMAQTHRWHPVIMPLEVLLTRETADIYESGERKQNNNHDGSVNHFLCPHCVGICHLNFWVAATAKLVVPVVYLWLLSNKAKTREKVEVGGKPLVWDTKATTGKESGGAEKAEGNPNAVPELRIKS